MKFRRSLLLLLFLRQNRVKNSQRMRVILPPPRSLHRAGGGGGNNSDYSQGRDYFNAENKNQMRACVAFGGLIYLNTQHPSKAPHTLQDNTLQLSANTTG